MPRCAFVNGTAAHGEIYDDTLKASGACGAVIVPAVLAACERHNPDGRMALIELPVGTEVLCRSVSWCEGLHKAGFHPTPCSVPWARPPASARPRLSAKQIVDALASPAAWPAASSNIAEGAWTNADADGAQSGFARALLRGGSSGPARVEGVHGLFHALRIPPRRLRRATYMSAAVG